MSWPQPRQRASHWSCPIATPARIEERRSRIAPETFGAGGSGAVGVELGGQCNSGAPACTGRFGQKSCEEDFIALESNEHCQITMGVRRTVPDATNPQSLV